MNKIKIYELYKLTLFFLFHNIGTFSQGLPVYLSIYIYKHRTHVNMITTLFFSMITKTTFAKNI